MEKFDINKLLMVVVAAIIMGAMIPVALVGWANQDFYDFYIANKIVEAEDSITLWPVDYLNDTRTSPSDPAESSVNISSQMILTNLTINESIMDDYDSVVLNMANISIKNFEETEVTVEIYFCEALWNETAGKMYPNMSSLEKDRQITVEGGFDGVTHFVEESSPVNLADYTINNNTLFVGLNCTGNLQINCTNDATVGDLNEVFTYNNSIIQEESGINAIFNYTVLYCRILWDYSISTTLTPYPHLSNETYREILFKITEFETEVLLNYTNFSLGSYTSNNINFTLKSSNPSVYESETYNIPFENDFYSALNVTIYRQYLTPQLEEMNITIYQKIYYQEFREKTELKTIFSLIPVFIILSLVGLFVWKRKIIE